MLPCWQPANCWKYTCMGEDAAGAGSLAMDAATTAGLTMDGTGAAVADSTIAAAGYTAEPSIGCIYMTRWGPQSLSSIMMRRGRRCIEQGRRTRRVRSHP
jgi:hypothetical protein